MNSKMRNISLFAVAIWASALLLFVQAQDQSPPPSLIDPRTRFNNNFTLPPPFTFPGLMTDINPQPDCGEESYVGQNRLRGRRALITGGDSGIGRAVAIAYAREGADVTINYLRSEESDAQSLRTLIETTTTSRIHLLPGDIREESFCTALVTNASRLMDGLDILVNNAGFSVAAPNITSVTTDNFIRTMRTNIVAPFFLTRAAVPLMPPGSSILFTSSDMRNNPRSVLADYAASKAWVAAFTEALAGDVTRTRGIRVNAVGPPLTLTPFLRSQGLTVQNASDAARQRPVGRIAQPVEVAPLFVWLAGAAATSVTGRTWDA